MRETINFGINPKSAKAWAFIALLVVCTTACSTAKRLDRWLTHRGSFNDAVHLPYTVVANDDAKLLELGSIDNPTLHRLLNSIKVDDETMENYFFNRNTNAMVILHQGDVVFERYANGFERDSIQPTYSVTKSIVGLLVDIAHADGLIDSLDMPIRQIVRGLSAEFSAVTIRHALNMVSGLGLNETEIFGVPAPWNDHVKEYYDPDLRRLINHMSIANEPNIQFTYQSYNQVLLGMVLENVTGMNLASYASEKLWGPIGMEYPAQWTIDSYHYGFAKPGSGFNATAVDLARLGQAVLTRPDVIPIDSLQKIIKPCCAQPSWEPTLKEAKAFPEFADHIRSVGYSNSWWGVNTVDRYDFYANGHFGQFIYVSPAAELVIVRLGSSHGGADDAEFGFQLYRFASEVISASASNLLGL